MKVRSDKLFLSILFLLFVAMIACSAVESDGATDLPEGYTFKPVEEIVDGDLEIANFGSDGTATLPIDTAVPVACSIVYGKTTEFGSLSVDQDMAGGAHSEHSPLLTGLEPETEYYYRVQGVDNRGVVYLSDVMTFTTPKFEVQETENLASTARGAEILGYSSAFGGAGLNDRWGAGSAFDDNPNTEWSSADDGSDAWIEVKLARRAKIDRIDFYSRSMGDGSAITLAFTVTTDDGDVYGPFEVPDSSGSHPFNAAFEAETLRFDLMETTGGNTGVADIAVYGEFLGE